MCGGSTHSGRFHTEKVGLSGTPRRRFPPSLCLGHPTAEPSKISRAGIRSHKLKTPRHLGPDSCTQTHTPHPRGFARSFRRICAWSSWKLVRPVWATKLSEVWPCIIKGIDSCCLQEKHLAGPASVLKNRFLRKWPARTGCGGQTLGGRNARFAELQRLCRDLGHFRIKGQTKDLYCNTDDMLLRPYHTS